MIRTTTLEARKIHICTFNTCQFRAVSLDHLRRHVTVKHKCGKTSGFQCPMCPSKFDSKPQLGGHLFHHTKEKPFKCDLCKFTASNSSAIAVHINAVHKVLKDYLCSFPGCNYSTAYSGHLKTHCRKHDPDPAVRRPFPCNFSACNYRGANAVQLKCHIRSRHSYDSPHGRPRTFTCPLCSKRFFNKASLERHVQGVHTKENIHNCDECDFATHDHRNLRTHLRKAHGKGKERKKYTCDSCDYIAYFSEQLNMHRRTKHMGERRFSCPQPGCSYRTNYGAALRAHVLTHETGLENQWPFLCSFPGCGFRRRVKPEITAYERRHMNSEMQCQCESCPKRFPDTKSLHFHECLEHDKRIFRCSQCVFVAFYRRFLLQHLQIYHNPNRVKVCASKCSGRMRPPNIVANVMGHQIPLVLLTKIRLKFV